MNFHSFFERFTREIWLQIIVLVLLLWGLFCMTGMSFERVENSSRAHVAGNQESSVPADSLSSAEDGSDPLDDLFSDESGAFGDWEEFSDLPRVSSETVRPPASSTQPVQEPSSQPVQEPSEPAESSEDSVEPPVSSSPSGEGPMDGPSGAVVIDPEGPSSPIEGPSGESSVPSAPSSGTDEPVGPSDPASPAESSAPAESSEPTPTDPGSTPSGGDSPAEAPDLGSQE